MLGLGTPEIIAIVIVLFLLFGATRLPQLAKSLGATRKAFKDGMREAEEEERSEKQLGKADAPQITEMSDDALAEEMRRRAEAKAN
ncbi:MAG: Sec-independent protein translocase subunit TatA/TatB [Pyrinomonadaceae bacterium]